MNTGPQNSQAEQLGSLMGEVLLNAPGEITESLVALGGVQLVNSCFGGSPSRQGQHELIGHLLAIEGKIADLRLVGSHIQRISEKLLVDIELTEPEQRILDSIITAGQSLQEQPTE